MNNLLNVMLAGIGFLVLGVLLAIWALWELAIGFMNGPDTNATWWR